MLLVWFVWMGFTEPVSFDLDFHRPLDIGPIVSSILDDDRLYLGDSDRIWVFERTGRHLLTIGEPGDQPGQIEQVDEIALLDGNRLALFNPGRRALMFYDRESGTFLKEVILKSFLLGIDRPNQTIYATDDFWPGMKKAKQQLDAGEPYRMEVLQRLDDQTLRLSGPTFHNLSPLQIAWNTNDDLHWLRRLGNRIHVMDQVHPVMKSYDEHGALVGELVLKGDGYREPPLKWNITLKMNDAEQRDQRYAYTRNLDFNRREDTILLATIHPDDSKQRYRIRVLRFDLDGKVRAFRDYPGHFANGFYLQSNTTHYGLLTVDDSNLLPAYRVTLHGW